MKISYSKEADALYIRLNDKRIENSDEISEDVILDFDANGNVVGIEVLNASEKFDVEELTIEAIKRVTVEHVG